MEQQQMPAAENPDPQQKKKSFSIKSFSKYLRELSVVIVGIAITFMVSGWISNHREKKDLENYLSAVKTELSNNLDILKEKYMLYERTAQLALYLQSTEKEKLSRHEIDRIATYETENEGYYIVNKFFVLTYKKSAMDMLQSSGMMRKIKDSSISYSILDCYDMLEALKKSSDDYMDHKLEILYNNFFKRDKFEIDILHPDSRELFIFLSIHVNNEKVFENCIKQIEKTLGLLH